MLISTITMYSTLKQYRTNATIIHYYGPPLAYLPTSFLPNSISRISIPNPSKFPSSNLFADLTFSTPVACRDSLSLRGTLGSKSSMVLLYQDQRNPCHPRPYIILYPILKQEIITPTTTTTTGGQKGPFCLVLHGIILAFVCTIFTGPTEEHAHVMAMQVKGTRR